jgi:exodeoxyribonuclease VII small subunit
MNQNPSYKEAFTELTTIVKSIESDQISVDELADKVKRASFLIDLCQKKLTSTEDEIKNILQQMETKAQTINK